MTTDTTLEMSFWSKVSKGGPTDCWNWIGAISTDGYGRHNVGRPQYAHRVAYTLANGPIGEGLQIDHLCRNRRCVNPAHLEAVTLRENVLRGTGLAAQAARRTSCVHGHPWNEANTYWRPDGGGRQCRSCAARRQRERTTARKVA